MSLQDSQSVGDDDGNDDGYGSDDDGVVAVMMVMIDDDDNELYGNWDFMIKLFSNCGCLLFQL